MAKYVSTRFLNRLPFYHTVLLTLKDEGSEFVTASTIARILSLNEEQVKKDLQIVSPGSGKPKVGRDVKMLLSDIEGYLGYQNSNDAVVIGVGNLGKAFLRFGGFKDIGVNVVAGFDNDKATIGRVIDGKTVYDFKDFDEILPKLKAQLAILTVPVTVADQVADVLVRNGIRAILNFCPKHLSVPDDIIVEDVNIASSMAIIRNKLQRKRR